MTTQDAFVFRAFTRAVFEAQNVLLKHGDVMNAPFGQTSARWRVMLRLSEGETSVASIASSTGYSRQGVQRLADSLVEDGLAHYSPNQEDRRKQDVTLTEEGKSCLQAMEDSFDEWASRLTEQLSVEELQHMTSLLVKAKAVVQEDLRKFTPKKETKDEG
jgi:DNA-binding MarR family transcriptional regulator